MYIVPNHKSAVIAFFIFLFPFSAMAMQFYSEFSMEQFDNDKANGFVEFWKMDCISTSSCDLSMVAFDCGKAEKVSNTKPFLDFYSTDYGQSNRGIKELTVISNGKEFPSARNLSFTFSQKYGPSEIKCIIDVSKKNVTKVVDATCSGSGNWAAGTKYKREWRLIKDGPFIVEKKCKNKIEFP